MKGLLLPTVKPSNEKRVDKLGNSDLFGERALAVQVNRAQHSWETFDVFVMRCLS